MRATLDISNRSVVEAPEWNRPASWPTWYPGCGWEKLVPIYDVGIWSLNNWHLSIYLTVCYLAFIVAGQRVMRERKPFNLQWPLVAWNAGLSLFSLIGAYVTLPYVIYMGTQRGFAALVCDLPDMRRQELVLWATLYAWSKVAEFGDTAFLVLRKRPVIHLHWIHHSIMSIGCFWMAHYLPVIGFFAMSVNYSIHAVMYGYYASRAAQLPVPVSFAMTITRVQIGQFFVAFPSLAYTYYLMEWTDRPCFNHPVFMLVALPGATIFTVLFINYFVQVYRHNNSAKAKAKAKGH